MGLSLQEALFLRRAARGFGHCFCLCGVNDETNEQTETPSGPVGVQRPLGDGLPFLQHSPAALRASDGDGLGVARRHGALFARAAAVAEGREGRAGGYSQTDRRRAADRRIAQGLHHVRFVDDLADRRFDHRHHRAAAGAGALRAAGNGPFHPAQDHGTRARHGGSCGGGAGRGLVVARAFASLGKRDDLSMRLRHVGVYGVVQAADRQMYRITTVLRWLYCAAAVMACRSVSVRSFTPISRPLPVTPCFRRFSC